MYPSCLLYQEDVANYTNWLAGMSSSPTWSSRNQVFGPCSVWVDGQWTENGWLWCFQLKKPEQSSSVMQFSTCAAGILMDLTWTLSIQEAEVVPLKTSRDTLPLLRWGFLLEILSDKILFMVVMIIMIIMLFAGNEKGICGGRTTDRQDSSIANSCCGSWQRNHWCCLWNWQDLSVSWNDIDEFVSWWWLLQ